MSYLVWEGVYVNLNKLQKGHVSDTTLYNSKDLELKDLI
jgi:hypothetical protein